MPKKQRAGRRTAKYRFELLIPSSYNDGRSVETEKIQRVRRTLVAKLADVACNLPLLIRDGGFTRIELMKTGWFCLPLKVIVRKLICDGLKD